MSYVTLELDNCFLMKEKRLESMTIGGAVISYGNIYWFLDPEFVVCLPANTWKALADFIEVNKEELDTHGVNLSRVGYLLTAPDSELMAPLLEVRRLPSGRSSYLFPPVVPVGKPYVQHDDIRDYPPFPLTEAPTTVNIGVMDSSTTEVLNGGGNPPVSENQRVMNYTYRPEYQFFAMPKERTKCYFGLELEVNTKVPWADVYRVMTQVAPIQEAFLFAKSDASISGAFDNSYEIVSHPMTPRRMRLEFSRLFKKLRQLVKTKGETWDNVFDMKTASTGIHIHVAKEAFSPLSRTHIKKFMLMWNHSGKTITDFNSKLAGRNIKENHYTCPAQDYRGRTLAWMLREGRNDDRHAACNETHNTIEVRVFRGQPCVSSVFHAIDTTEAALKFTEQMPNSQVNMHLPTHFTTWLGKQNTASYRNLKESLKCA